MAKPLFSDNIPHSHYVSTRWAVPAEPLKPVKIGQEIDYSDTITMNSGGSGYWKYCNNPECEKVVSKLEGDK